jgi:hypothetical protein
MMKRAVILFCSIILTMSLMILSSGCASDTSKGQPAPADQPASAGGTSQSRQSTQAVETAQAGTTDAAAQTVETAQAGQTVAAESNADAADTSGQVATASEPSEEDNGLWTSTEMPVKLIYGCVNETFLEAETEDPVIIGQAIDAIKSLEIGEANNMETLDAGDDLHFIFEDGSEVRLTFEGDNWITDDHERYHVEGLSRLHSVLYVLFEE